jgi:hypothetical protein
MLLAVEHVSCTQPETCGALVIMYRMFAKIQSNGRSPDFDQSVTTARVTLDGNTVVMQCQSAWAFPNARFQ